LLNEGQMVTLSATGSDPEGTAVTFEWDLDNDGTFGFPGIVPHTFIDGPNLLTVGVRVTDATGWQRSR
jgi:hypothetical protein